MLTCEDIANTASDYLDEPKGITRRIQFYLHLLICNNCRHYVQKIKLVINMVKINSPKSEPSDAEIDGVVEAIKNKMAPKS